MKITHFGLLVFSYILILNLRFDYELPSILKNYWSDLLCLPILLTVIRYIIIYFTNDLGARLSLAHIGFAVMGVTLGAEIILPTMYDIHVQDYLDFFAYVLGGMYFYISQPELIVD